MLANTTLATRSQEFSSLIQGGSFTDVLGQAISVDQGVNLFLKILRKTKKQKSNVYIVGNGGSAAIASHVATDYCNVGGLCAMTLHEPSVITCIANDIGYADVFSARLKKIAKKSDVLIVISSSGNSANIINAAAYMNEIGASVLTLSGFSKANPLRKMGGLNFWVNSDEYGLVEVAHLFTLHHISDLMSLD